MSSSNTVLTPEQQAAAIAKFVSELQAALAPARLNLDGPAGDRNGYLLKGELDKRGLPNDIPNIVAVINAILFENKLEWSIEPKKLQAQKNSNPNAPLMEKTAWKEKLDSEATRVANTKTVEQAAAKKKADDESIKRSRDLISGYNPIKKGRYDNAEREEMQKKWSAALDAEIANKGNLQTFAQALATVIQNRYDAREKALERL